MSTSTPPVIPQLPAKRSVFITILAWTIIVLSGVMLPISVITVMVKSYGTASATLMGFLTVVVPPPVMFVAGIGLLFRRAWAWYGLLLLLGSLVAYNTWELLFAPPPMTIRTFSNGTVTATPSEFGTAFNNIPILAFCAVALMIMLSRSALSACGILRKPDAPAHHRADAGIPASMERPPGAVPPALPHDDWRVGHQGRDMMHYEERHAGGWQRIKIDGEMLTGRAHHVIYFASANAGRVIPSGRAIVATKSLAASRASFARPTMSLRVKVRHFLHPCPR